MRRWLLNNVTDEENYTKAYIDNDGKLCVEIMENGYGGSWHANEEIIKKAYEVWKDHNEMTDAQVAALNACKRMFINVLSYEMHGGYVVGEAVTFKSSKSYFTIDKEGKLEFQ